MLYHHLRLNSYSFGLLIVYQAVTSFAETADLMNFMNMTKWFLAGSVLAVVVVYKKKLTQRSDCLSFLLIGYYCQHFCYLRTNNNHKQVYW